jgi:tetratricopeptide (TPR) repeat protein
LPVEEGVAGLLRHFREAFRREPTGAYRDWFRLQEELRDSQEEQTAKALAADLWQMLPELTFGSPEERARFFHNVAVFFGSPGPAADLSRARHGFSVALEHFTAQGESGWHARALHNYATALSNLASRTEEIEEAITLFERALTYRTVKREIARGVTLHHLGLAFRQLAELEPGRAAEALERSAATLREALTIRERHQLAEGHALSLFQLALSLERLAAIQGEPVLAEARQLFEEAAREFDRLGKRDSASIARERLPHTREAPPP